MFWNKKKSKKDSHHAAMLKKLDMDLGTANQVIKYLENRARLPLSVHDRDMIRSIVSGHSVIDDGLDVGLICR